MCQKTHWEHDHEHACSEIKKQRLLKWDEISILATAYTTVTDMTRALSMTIRVWSNVNSMKGKHQPLSPILSRLAEIQAALSSNDYSPMEMLDIEKVNSSKLQRSVCAQGVLLY
jgi:hypothetical protein